MQFRNSPVRKKEEGLQRPSNSPRLRSPRLANMPTVRIRRMMVMRRIVSVMMQRDAVELLEGIRDLAAGSREPGVERDALHLAGAHAEALVGAAAGAEVDALGLLDVAEIQGVDAAALVGDDGGFGVAQQGPGGGAEERVGFDVRGAGARAEAAELVFDEEFADEGFAEAGRRVSGSARNDVAGWGLTWRCLGIRFLRGRAPRP